ncbi:MAG: hypothetical protein CM1200mP39_28720 [Dehalococcoidia bacterium]|nr:MAG: hypothetical protein CM1200mP39_28720 [Dehalococcoidia bacterium]
MGTPWAPTTLGEMSEQADLWNQNFVNSRVSIGKFLQPLNGVPLGVLAAFYGGGIDAAIMRFIDAKMAIPGLCFQCCSF